MNVLKTQIDPLNAELKVSIDKADYQDKVDGILKDYRKNANIPGFRKGQVPMGMIKKQYGQAVLIDEVNKLIQNQISSFLEKEKLAILGNPIPKEDGPIDWEADTLNFDFELGLSPEFEVEVKSKKAITHYKIVADKKMLDEQVDRIQKQYGKVSAGNQVETSSEITGTFKSEELGIDNKTTLTLDLFKAKKAVSAVKGGVANDSFELEAKGLFKDDATAARAFGKNNDEIADLKGAVQFTIEAINEREPAELNQELFDKLFGEGVVNSEKELRAKIAEDAEGQFVQQADQKLLNDITEYLVDNTKFDLPDAFLTKWIQVSGENPLTEEEAAAEYEKAKQGLRYQLIEGKVIEANELQINFDELKDFEKGFIKDQMAQYGQLNPQEEELDGIAARVLQNQDEVKRLQEQLMSKKLIDLYKEKANLKTKEISYDKFVAEVYGA